MFFNYAHDSFKVLALRFSVYRTEVLLTIGRLD